MGSRVESEKLKKEIDYVIQICEVKSKRSLQQNDMLWGLIKEIETATGVNGWDVYCQLLQMANAKFEYFLVLPESIPMLQEQMRAVQDMRQSRTVNGHEMTVVKCFYGSSKFSTKEMNVLLDKAIEIAEGYGVNTDEWRNEKYE